MRLLGPRNFSLPRPRSFALLAFLTAVCRSVCYDALLEERLHLEAAHLSGFQADQPFPTSLARLHFAAGDFDPMAFQSLQPSRASTEPCDPSAPWKTSRLSHRGPSLHGYGVQDVS